MTSPIRGLARIVVLTALTVAMMLVSTNWALAQQTGLKDEIYISPHWGYEIRWYSSEWVVSEDDSQENTDTLGLQDSLGNHLTFTGMEAYDGDAEACLDDMTASAQVIPGATDFLAAESEFGGPFEWRDPTQSYAVFQIRLPVGGVLVDHVAYAECQTLAPGEAVFKRLYLGPTAVFDQWYDDIVETIEGVFLPASALIADESGFLQAGQAPLFGNARASGDTIVDDEGNPELLVGQVDVFGDVRVVSFENAGTEEITVDPANIVLAVTPMMGGEDLLVAPPSAASWEDGNGVAGGSRVLAPGVRAAVQVTFAPIETSTVDCQELPVLALEYRVDDDNKAVAATEAITSCADTTVGAPPVAGRPILQYSR